MKILITGSCGLVGASASRLFLEKGWEVVGIDNNMRSYLFGTKRHELMHNRIDIRDETAINELFRAHTFDAIIHAAAQPSHDWSKENPIIDFDINARGTLLLLEAARKYNKQAPFVYVSTDKVYGENMMRELEELPTRYHSDMPYAEDLGLDFTMRSCFGCSKASADMYVQEYGRYFGMQTVCFRPGCITGRNHEGAELHGFLAYLAKCIRRGTEYKIFGYQGKQVRDQIHADDLAAAFYAYIQNPRPAEVYNIGGGPERSVSILEAIHLIEAETNKKAFFSIYPEPRRGDRQWDVHDVSKFRGDYPEWNYQYDLPAIIKDLCEKTL